MPELVLGKVPSRTQAGVEYDIRRLPSGQLGCSCKGWYFNREQPKRCPHTDDFVPPEAVRRVPWDAAKPAADVFPFLLAPFCNRRPEKLVETYMRGREVLQMVPMVAVAGSLRRYKADVKDIDIVASVRDPDGALARLQRLADVHVAPATWTLMYCGLKVEVYLAGSPEEYVPLLVWRTGSFKSNIALAEGARRLGRRVTKRGVVEGLRRIAWETEEAIFEACGVPYRQPWERD